jgi:hypothetical protein
MTSPAAQIALDYHSRWVDNFIEGANWCPFARSSRLAGRTTLKALSCAPALGDPLTHWDELPAWLLDFADSPDAEVMQVVVPRVMCTAADWEHRAKQMLDEFQALRGGRSVLALAAFHPQLMLRYETPPGLIPLLRRSPLPAIQFVRLDALARVKKGRDNADRFVSPGSPEFHALLLQPVRESISDAITRTNFDTIKTAGRASVEASLHALAEEAANALREAGVELVSWNRDNQMPPVE